MEIMHKQSSPKFSFKKTGKNANPHEANLEMLTIIFLKNSKTKDPYLLLFLQM